MVKYEYKVLDGKSQTDIERKLNELAEEGYRLASFNINISFGRSGNPHTAVMERRIGGPNRTHMVIR